MTVRRFVVRRLVKWGLIGLVFVCPQLVPVVAMAIDDHHWQLANSAVDRGLAYMITKQNDDGSWSPQPGPAITAMVLAVMLDRSNVSVADKAVNQAIKFVRSKCRSDGGIHDGILENYNTAICLAALARVNDRTGVAKIIEKGHAYLRGLQWHDQTDPKGAVVNSSHPYFGGAGYGRHGRPDMSNTQIMLEGLYESGMDCNDPVFLRAMVFITRCQGTQANRDLGGKIIQDGGFIYATSINKDHIGVPQSMASSEQIELAKAGKQTAPLRTYGSMTYAGFKSYLYANLDRDDVRVLDAYNWIRSHYTLASNPGMAQGQEMQGYYYYLVTFSKALSAWGHERIITADGVEYDWANDLVDTLVKIQRKDGSWVNETDRWMEGDVNLTTAYALTALVYAIR